MMVLPTISLRVLVFSVVATLVGFTTASVRAGGLLKNPVNAVTGTVTTVVDGTPLGSSGPIGPNGPLISTPSRPGRAITGAEIASGRSTMSHANPPELTSSGRTPQATIKGTIDAARLPVTLQKPIQSTVTAISNDSVTIATPNGPATLKLPPGSVATSRMLVGSKVAVIPNSNGISVQLRITDAAPKPYGGIYVGMVQTVGKKAVTLRFTDGTLHSFAASPRLLQRINTAKGKTVALASSDGLVTRRLLTAKELDHVAASIPDVQNRYIGRIVNVKNSAVTLDLGQGTLQTLQCSACAGDALHGVPLISGQAVYAIGDAQGRLVNLAAIPNGTRIVGQVAAASPTSVSIMFGSGDITTLPCDCTAFLQNVGAVAVGDAIIADLNQSATVTSLARFPDNGRITGQIVNITANRLDLKLPSGVAQSFICNCPAGRFDAALLGIGNTIAVGLNADAQVAAINPATTSSVAPAPTTTPSTIAAAPTPRPSVRCRPGSHKSNKKTSPCADGSATDYTALHGGVDVRSPMTAILGCGQDSSSIFIAVRDGRTRRPMDNAEVRLSGPASISLMSPPSGYMELLNIPAGKYLLKVRKAGFGEAGTAQFSVLCNDGVRVEANLRAVPQTVRVVRIRTRQVASRVVVRQRLPLRCMYASKAPNRFDKFAPNTTMYKAANGYYTCRVKKTRLTRTSQR